MTSNTSCMCNHTETTLRHWRILIHTHFTCCDMLAYKQFQRNSVLWKWESGFHLTSPHKTASSSSSSSSFSSCSYETTCSARFFAFVRVGLHSCHGVFERAPQSSRTWGAACDEQVEAYANTDNEQPLPNSLPNSADLLPSAAKVGEGGQKCNRERQI